jgi:hypothetical protein
MAEEPFYFLEGKTPKFFDEGAERVGESVDLMGFDYDGDASYGMLDRIVTGAREVLADAPPGFARACLWFADTALDAMLDQVNLLSSEGERIDRASVDFKKMNQLDTIPLIFDLLGKESIVLGDSENGISGYEVTQARLSAAFALRMAFNATRDFLQTADDLREYYLLQAAAAYGLMIATADLSEVSKAIASSVKRETAKTMAQARWSRDPSRLMWEAVRADWEQWQSNRSLYRLPRDFRRAMQLKFPELVDGTLKNRMSEWGRGEA